MLQGRNVWVMAKGYRPDEGGMQTYAQGVAEAYAAKGARVTVFTQTSAGSRRERVGPVTLVDIGPGKSPLVLPRFLQALQREKRETGTPDLIHATTWRTSVPPMLLGLPYITSFHGREFMYPKGIALAVMRHVARKAKRIVTVSHYSARRLAERLGPQMPAPLVAWNGLSDETENAADMPLPEKFSTRHGGIPLIFSLCRLEPRKNIAAAVRACAEAKAAGHVFRYVIGGRGPELEPISALVRDLNLESCVEVAGFLSNDRVRQLYREADLFLHPQIEVDGGRDFEGFGIAIADAMITGTAVIAGIDGGARELIEDGVSGFSVDGHSLPAITSALTDLLVDPARRMSMGKAARSRAAANFTWGRHVDLAVGGLFVT
jgi:glycosyltransferase involved in cell wall biosynthesis